MNFYHVIENALYLLAILNPPSKVLFLASYQPKLTNKQNFELSWKASVAALVMLCTFAAFGHYIFERIFRVELYSLQITGGIILFFMGYRAINAGRFVNKSTKCMENNFNEISLVPLAAPLIAGPGTIAASITESMANGLSWTMISLTIALFINFILMLFSSKINSILSKLHLVGPLIRFTGLIISCVAVQMIIHAIITIIAN